MQLAHEIRKTDTKTALIFVTSLAQYAVESYDIGASNYILKPMLYAGSTLDLCSQPIGVDQFFDKGNAKDAAMPRKATHETLYVVANSNAMANEIDHYEMAYWNIVLTAIDVVIPVGLAIWGIFAIRSAYKAERSAPDTETKDTTTSGK